eukprot:64774-Chlamydomonas_euryale.AAC.1
MTARTAAAATTSWAATTVQRSPVRRTSRRWAPAATLTRCGMATALPPLFPPDRGNSPHVPPPRHQTSARHGKHVLGET